MQDLENMKKMVDTTGHGVWVQASTLGSLEALLAFLKQSKIPVSGVNIGPISKKDVMKASVMLEHAPEYAVMLAFDVKVPRDVRDVADELGVKIFTAEIIYHLFDQFTAYIDDLKKKTKEESAPEAVFPVRLRIFPEYIFNKKDPILLGVEVIDGQLRLGTPIVVPSKDVRR
jgi:translation initiation factor 5B